MGCMSSKSFIQLHIFKGACLLMFYVHESHPPASMTSKLHVPILDIVAGGGGSHPLQILGSRFFFFFFFFFWKEGGGGTEISEIFLGGELTLHATMILQIPSITLQNKVFRNFRLFIINMSKWTLMVTFD